MRRVKSSAGYGAPQRLLRIGGGGVAQHVAAAPDGLDVIVAARRGRELLAQLADEDIDDLELGLVHAAVKVVEEHLLGERRALAQREELEDAVLLAGEVERRAFDLDDAAVEIDEELAGADDALGMALSSPHDRLDAGDELAAVEGFRQEVVGPEAEALDAGVEVVEAGEDED